MKTIVSSLPPRIHLPHSLTAHLTQATVLVIGLHNMFPVPATTPTNGLFYCLNLFMHHKILNRCHTSYPLNYADGTECS
jgi:hypothetical protein